VMPEFWKHNSSSVA